MEILQLQSLYARHPNVKAMAQALEKSSVRTFFLGGLCASSAPLFLSCILKSTNSSFLVILQDLEEAGYFYHDLTQILGGDRVLFFPSSYRRAIKYGQKDAADEILRTEVLSVLQKGGEPLCVVTYPDALAEKVIPPDQLSKKTIQIAVGDSFNVDELCKRLTDSGFQQVDYVYEPGQFALRGSILDIFSFSFEYPFRVDFFGNDVDSIRSFEVETQLSKEKKDHISLVPEMVHNASGSVSLMDFLAPDSILMMKDFLYVQERIDAVSKETFTSQAITAQEQEEGEKIYLPALMDGSSFTLAALNYRRVEFGNKPTGVPQATFTFDCAVQPNYHKNFDMVSSSFLNYLEDGYSMYILSDSAKQADRIKDIFEERGDAITFTPVSKTLHEGFSDKTLHLCCFTDHQIFDRFHKYNIRSDKARSGKVALSLKEINEFQPGDYIVHIDHGIGKFAGLVRIPNGDSTQEVIKLVFQNDDVVFVSIHSLHKISKYKGKEGEPPRLSKLGTGAWEKMKDRAKSNIKNIARDLIKLYSQRKEEKGFSYSPDSFMQHELEASFIYEDTPDQLKATQDVKADMEKDRPMDRLICGDVGFGKTEVAIRAAFKATADNKQVAVLVPTTVLAFQHFKTFSERLKEFPVKIDYLSRARKPADVKQVLKELADGTVNIIVGTHRLIGKDVKFKDLGLLIIDEEQKFGVSVKEKLRQLKVNIDTLTMTATPIPRTLQFSLMGARDFSVIQTPPPNRYPVQTEVHTFNEDIISEAINFEMSRNGQVFIVNNRIQNLGELQDMVERLVPDARVCVGHGQMEADKLEKIIFDFINYDYDVMIATSIIENGIDIPNVNTILINAAQNFGLSDLHQLRGRVGRGNKKAFCYLLAPPLSTLTPEARRRLQAIENFNDLGSGIHIAMQDLDIRGAGNLLGAEQSGFIADLGYETYQKILAEAVTELKNDEFADLYADELKKGPLEISGGDFVTDCSLDSDLELLFPANYIPSSSERMLLYRELDSLETDADVEAFRLRLEDRFGKVPAESEELLKVVPLRRLSKHLGIERIYLKSGRMSLFFVSNLESPYYQSTAFGQIIAYLSKNARQCKLREQAGKRSLVVSGVTSVSSALTILQQITNRENK